MCLQFHFDESNTVFCILRSESILLTTESVILNRREAFLSSFSFLFSLSPFLRAWARRLTPPISRPGARSSMPHSSGSGIGSRPSSFRRPEKHNNTISMYYIFSEISCFCSRSQNSMILQLQWFTIYFNCRRNLYI